MPYQSYKDLLSKISDRTHRWSAHFARWLNCDAFGRKPSPISLLLLGTLRYLGRGWTFDDIEEATGISGEVHRCFFHTFTDFGSTVLYNEYINTPENRAEAEKHMHEFKEAGFNGCMGSMDATHVKMDRCSNIMQLANKGYKMPFPARTYNTTVNHRRRILSTTRGHPARWNDKTLIRYDDFATALKDGSIMSDNIFELQQFAADNTVETVKYRGAWLLVDNGYLNWSCTVPPFKMTLNQWEAKWSKWLESMRKDVECCFGILKGRWRVLKAGVRSHGTASCDKIWLTCCAFHNMLLDVDGLDVGWQNSVDASSASRWQRSAGNFDDSDIPAPIRRLHGRLGIQNHSFDLSSMGRGNDAPSLAVVEKEAYNSIEYDLAKMIEPDGTMVVRHMPLDLFRSKLVEHFKVLFTKNQIKWPSRCGLQA